MLYFWDKQFYSQHISLLKYLMVINQNSPEQDQSLISVNQTVILINLLLQLINIFIIS